MYKPIYKPNQVVCGTGRTAIITGWTVMKTVKNKLSPEQYAVIGQLYSPTRGINLLLRNLLANPDVRHLVILDATKEDRNAGACQCLSDFFINGFHPGKSDNGTDCWVVNSTIAGYIDIEVTQEALASLRNSIQVRTATTVDSCVAQVKSIYEAGTVLPPTRKKLIFPMKEIVPVVFPGELYGHRIQGSTIAETWVKIIHRIKTTGTIRPTGYDGNWQELIDLTAIVTDEPEDFYFPEPNYLSCDRDFVKEYIPSMLFDSPYQEGVKYTYGQRLRSWFGKDQVKDVIAKLINEIDSASAVMNLWDSGTGNEEFIIYNGYEYSSAPMRLKRFGRSYGDSDHDHGGSPCLNHIWLRVVDGILSMTALFRSNDMFSAWPANAMGLRALQKHIRDEIDSQSDYDLKMGALITISQSAHIYDDCWENADRLIEQQYSAICNKREYNDAVGNFLIDVENKEIVVTHTTPGSGEVLGNYKGRNALQLVRQISMNHPTIQPEHIGYLGMELQKAQFCLECSKTFTQDQKVVK